MTAPNLERDAAALALDELGRQRFWDNVSISTPERCWLWKGRLYNGYGRFSARRGQVGAHRAAYLLARGEIGLGLVVDHVCHNRACVNPHHLRLVSLKTNTLENSAAITAENARKAFCKRGHPFSTENTRMHARPDGLRRRCLACEHETNKARDRRAAR